MEIEDDKRGAGVRFPPPLIVLALVAGGYLLHRLLPFPVGDASWRWIVGAGSIALGLAIILTALLQFKRAQTPVEPWQPTTTIIRHGPYRYSRNPIYLAFCIATVGIGLCLNSWWIIAALLPLVYLLQRLVIRREEAYLEARFGQAYLAYRHKVRRWL